MAHTVENCVGIGNFPGASSIMRLLAISSYFWRQGTLQPKQSGIFMILMCWISLFRNTAYGHSILVRGICVSTRFPSDVMWSLPMSLIAKFMGPIWDRQDPSGPMNLAIWGAAHWRHILREQQ